MFKMVKIFDFEFEKKGEAEFEMVRKEKGADVIIFAKEALLRQMDEEVFIQAKNVSMLPGLVGPVAIMPDAHSGYGAPIGTVFAMDEEEGYVSPGAVGYDINCLPGKTKILTEFGYRKEISHFGKKSDDLSCLDFTKKKEDKAGIIFFLQKYANPHLVRVKTRLGKEIVLTDDHPVYSTRGMVEANRLAKKDKLAVSFFEGVDYLPPPSKTIIDHNIIAKLRLRFKSKNSLQSIIHELKKRNLLPLKYNNPKLPYLIKILAYNIGDGNLTFTKKTQAVAFWGKEDDLADIVRDLKKVGYKTKIYQRRRKYKIGNHRFAAVEYSIGMQCKSLAVLLCALGGPVGNKTNRTFRIPSWLKKAPLWQKRLFLASFFGAEMSTPKTMKGNPTTFYMPTLSVNKSKNQAENGYQFLTDIKNLLKEFRIKTTEVVRVKEKNKGGGEKIRLRLLLDASNENLIRLYSLVNFEYHRQKRYLANVAVAYLKLKEDVLVRREKAERKAKKTYQGKGSLKKVVDQLQPYQVNKRFIERSIFEQRKSRVRIPLNFPSFEEFILKRTTGLGKSGVLWDKIAKIDKVAFSGKVYDFTVNHKGHNFIANGFVVSNCGMRLLRTNLSLEEIKPQLEKIVNLLFNYVPAGVGRKGFLTVSRQELKMLVEEGVAKIVKMGFGWREDVEKIEARGKIEGADMTAVSNHAVDRGLKQLATLGSGNHYLEIQKVADILDKKKADLWGIKEKNQIVIMIHCGSRGFGHQICTDYLRIYKKHLPEFKVDFADIQLISAPIKSKPAKDYLAAMAAAANFAFVNRQAITYRVRKAFEQVLGKKAEDLDLKIIYDVAHNIGKFEEHQVPPSSKRGRFLIHRKGATRAFPNQPVIIGGSMETGSYLLSGTEGAMKKTYGSTAHGSGRTMSRTKAKKMIRGENLLQKMKQEGIYIKSASFAGLAEEAGFAYKNVSDVVKSVDQAGISKPVAYLKPIGNIKG